MRLLLDAHISGRAIATQLRRVGHDVVAVDEDRNLVGADDESLLALAAVEDRILVTADVKDFPDILRDWADESRPHGGCIIVAGVGHHEFGVMLRLLDRVIEQTPEQAAWRNRAVIVGRG